MTRSVLVSLILIAALSAGCGRKNVEPVSKAAAPLSVRVAPAGARSIERAIAVTGSLVPDETVTCSAEVAGRIARVHVDFGQKVAKGQVIAELDRQEYQIALDRAKASLTQSLARIGLSSTEENVTPETTPAMRQARAQMEDARFKLDSAARLVKSGDISRERYNEVEKSYNARLAAFEATRDDLLTQLATVQAIQAEVRLAAKHLSDTIVRAPFDGAVTARNASPGQYMKENTPIVTLVKTWPLRLRAEIPESATSSAHAGTALTFSTDAAPGVEFHAIVRELNPSLDARARSLTVEARLVEQDSRLRPGGFVQVRLVMEREARIVTVPRQAVFSVAGLSKVFVVRGGKVAECRIPPGPEGRDWVEVPAGIEAGELVATTRLDQLIDGSAVAVVKE